MHDHDRNDFKSSSWDASRTPWLQRALGNEYTVNPQNFIHDNYYSVF